MDQSIYFVRIPNEMHYCRILLNDEQVIKSFDITVVLTVKLLIILKDLDIGKTISDCYNHTELQSIFQ